MKRTILSLGIFVWLVILLAGCSSGVGTSQQIYAIEEATSLDTFTTREGNSSGYPHLPNGEYLLRAGEKDRFGFYIEQPYNVVIHVDTDCSDDCPVADFPPLEGILLCLYYGTWTEDYIAGELSPECTDGFANEATMERILDPGFYFISIMGERGGGFYSLKTEIEPGPDKITAIPIELPFEGSFIIESQNDQDFFSLLVDEDTIITVDVKAERIGSNLDVKACVYGEYNDEICEDDIEGSDPVIIQTLDKERTYYISVSYVARDPGPYHLSVHSTPTDIPLTDTPSTDGPIPGKDFDSALLIDLPYKDAIAISEPDNEYHYFIFNQESRSEITIEAEVDEGNSYQSCLHQELLGELQCGSIIKKILNPGLYFVQVSINSSTEPYTLNINTKVGTGFDLPRIIQLPLYGHLTVDEVDFFSFYLQESSPVFVGTNTIRLNSNVTPQWEILDSNKNPIITQLDNNFTHMEMLEAGQYYINIASDGSDTGSYLLFVGLEPADYMDFALPLEFGEATHFQIVSNNDKDFYSFDLDQHSKVSIELDSTLNLNICIIAESNSWGDCEESDKTDYGYVTKDALSKGSYYLKIISTEAIGTYTLKLDKIVLPPPTNETPTSDLTNNENGEPGLTCDGTKVGGYCWHLGDENKSCEEVCNPYGGYSDATRTYAGSNGSWENCRNVIEAMDIELNEFYSTAQGGIGCFIYKLTTGQYNGYWDEKPTTADATYGKPGRERICACQRQIVDLFPLAYFPLHFD